MSRAPVLTLERLEVKRLPGIDDAFSVRARPGVNFIVGPNEVGKSSLVRGVFHLLWPTTPVPGPCQMRCEFVDAQGPLQARCEDAGSVYWSRDGDPVPAPELPGADLARCYRLGLLDVNRRDGGDLDRQLAVEISRQMSGGYDLPGLREMFPEQAVRWSRGQSAWAKARQELLHCGNRQRNLLEQERGLAEQEADKEAAQRAVQRVERLKAVLRHQQLGRQAAALSARLAELPAGMEHVRPGDDEALSELLARRQTRLRRLQTLQQDIERRANQMSALLSIGDLGALDALVRQAEAQAQRLAESARGLTAAEAALAMARAELPAELQDIPAGSAPTAMGTDAAFRRLVRAHREILAHELRVEDLARLRGLQALQEPSGRPAAADDIAAEALLDAGALVPPARTPLATALLAVAAGLVLLLSGVTGFSGGEHLPGLMVLLLLLAIAGGSLWQWLRQRRARQNAQRRLQEMARAAGHELPAGAPVHEAVAAVRSALLAVGRSAGAADLRTDINADLQRRGEEAAADLQAAVARRRDLVLSIGREDAAEDADLLHEWDRVTRCREALLRAEEARAAHEHDAAALTGILVAAQSHLAGLGLTVDAEVVALRAALESLRQQSVQLASLHDSQTRDELEATGASDDLAVIDAGLRALAGRLNLPGPADASDGDAFADAAEIVRSVTRRVSALDRFAEWNRQAGILRGEQAQIAAGIEGDADGPPLAELIARPTAVLEAELAAEQRLAGGYETLTTEIARTRERIDQARHGQEWELARAQEAEHASDLVYLLDERRQAALGRLLLDVVEERHELDTQPPLLTAINEHLALFTGGRYRLRVSADAGGGRRFVALDNTDRRLELGELSDGTRAQLLLAARLAFVTQQESGLLVPLILDEALTASDPDRFDAIAGALGALAADSGRQVFYLTSNPADVAAWQDALARRGLAAGHQIDLGLERGAAKAAAATALAAPRRTSVPAPQGQSAAEYGVRLLVPTVRPWQHEGSLDLFHLWKDNLDLVHRLRVGGVATIGGWNRLGANLLRAGVINEDEADRIEARNRLYGAFADVWRVGRGRPLVRDDLVASGALSANMLPPAVELLGRTKGDAAAFLHAARQGGIKRLNRAKKEALQEFLEREGHLDPRDVWSPDATVAYVLGQLGRQLASGALAADEVRVLVLDLHRGAQAD